MLLLKSEKRQKYKLNGLNSYSQLVVDSLHWFTYLSAWSPFVKTAWEGLGCVILLEEVRYW